MYEGEFDNNNLNGEGKLYLINGKSYKGKLNLKMKEYGKKEN